MQNEPADILHFSFFCSHFPFPSDRNDKTGGRVYDCPDLAGRDSACNGRVSPARSEEL
jgi:hypothetical protein